MHIIGSSVAYLEDSKYYILLKHAKGVECYLQTNLIKRRGSRMIQISLDFLKTQSCEWDTSNKILTICIEDNSKKINSLYISFSIFFIFFLFNIIDSVFFSNQYFGSGQNHPIFNKLYHILPVNTLALDKLLELDGYLFCM